MTIMMQERSARGYEAQVVEGNGSMTAEGAGIDRRQHRRHDFEPSEVTVDRWEGARREGRTLGRIMDLSVTGIRIRTSDASVRADQQIRLRLQLPVYAGINPFVDSRSDTPCGTNEWVGWMAVTRVVRDGDQVTEIAGRLVDMDDMDRGMLGLYLSTQPLSA